ncbi:MAG: sulfatase-like hydrolase/transferase [Pirellulaceae bacterium]
MTVSYTQKTVEFIERNKDQPFCVVLSHFAVHIPLQAKEAMIRHFAEKEKPDDRPFHPTYAAMLAHVDERCGRILDQLDWLGLSNRTVVVFTSDNGGYAGRHATLCPDGAAYNAPLRGGKGMLYEGGAAVCTGLLNVYRSTELGGLYIGVDIGEPP